MKSKIQSNLEKGRYLPKEPSAFVESYVNKDGGWTDYLLSDRILFSHRMNDYSSGELPERLHAHNYYELTLIADGEGLQYIADGQSISVHSGMAILTKPMKMHMFRLGKRIDYDRYVLYFKNVSDLFPNRSIMNFTEMGNDSCAVFELPDRLLLSYAEAAEKVLFDARSSYSDAKAYLNICDLFLTLSYHNAIPVSNVPVPHFMNEIKEYIDKNFLKIRSVGELSERFFYSREYISRSFRQYYNTPLYEYILERKMRYCCALLRQGQCVEAAAHNSGFGNMSSFIKLFRKYNECTPSEYKMRYR